MKLIVLRGGVCVCVCVCVCERERERERESVCVRQAAGLGKQVTEILETEGQHCAPPSGLPQYSHLKADGAAVLLREIEIETLGLLLYLLDFRSPAPHAGVMHRAPGRRLASKERSPA